MYAFISSCKDEREITYENYIKKSVVSVVFYEKPDSIDPKSEKPICSLSVVHPYSKSPDSDQICSPQSGNPVENIIEAQTECEIEELVSDRDLVEKYTKHSLKDDSGFKKFQADIRKRAIWRRTCVICGSVSDHDLVIRFRDGYQCNACHMAHMNEIPEQKPPVAAPQRDPPQMTFEKIRWVEEQPPTDSLGA